jgi:hypothetical protein
MDVNEIQLDLSAPVCMHLDKNSMTLYDTGERVTYIFRGEPGMIFHRAVQITNETFYIDGALAHDKKIDHCGMMYGASQEVKYVQHSDMGFIPLSLVAIGNMVYFIAANTCEAVDLERNRRIKLPSLPTSALNAGC